MKTNADITIWNRITRGGREEFIPTQIRGVSFAAGTAAKMAGYGITPARESTGTVSIRIPENAIVQGGRLFVKSENYHPDKNSASWTLREGDIIAPGLYEGALPESGFYRVTGFSDNRDTRSTAAGRHWRVSAG